MKSVLIAAPIYDAPTVEFMHSIMGVLGARTALKVAYKPNIGIGDISKARNNLARYFLDETKCDYMLSVDSDMSFAVNDVERLVLRDLPLIGGLYRQRVIQRQPLYVLNTLTAAPFNPRASDLQEVRYAGTGFLLIHRTVFEQIAEANPELAYVTDSNEAEREQYGFFECMIRDHRRLSGDWAFCQRWLDLEGKVFVDCARVIPHLGKAPFA